MSNLAWYTGGTAKLFVLTMKTKWLSTERLYRSTERDRKPHRSSPTATTRARAVRADTCRRSEPARPCHPRQLMVLMVSVPVDAKRAGRSRCRSETTQGHVKITECISLKH